MARYTGPTTRIARKFGEPIYGPDKTFEKRNTPPGQHGLAAKRKKQKEYGTQLKEKQKVKYMYGVLERQFRNTYARAARMKGQTGENLLVMLEERLDNVVYRMGLSTTRREARQLVTHGHFTVNGKKVDIPSYQVKPGDVIKVKEKSQSSPKFKEIKEMSVGIPGWLSVDREKLEGKVLADPTRDQIDTPIEEHLIVELYSK